MYPFRFIRRNLKSSSSGGTRSKDAAPKKEMSSFSFSRTSSSSIRNSAAAMSLQKYTAFLKTVELGSLSLAAEQMGYTQPAVSKMIQDLEREWGMELLHRSRAGVELSSVGQHLLPLIRSIVADCEEIGRASCRERV